MFHLFGTGRNINICAHNGRQETISATTFSRCTIGSHLRVSARRQAMAPERSQHHYPLPMWVRTARQCERRIDWTRRAQISGAICGPKCSLILLHISVFGCKSGGRLGSKFKMTTPGPRHNTKSCLRLVGERHAFAHVAHQDFSPVAQTGAQRKKNTRPHCQSKKKKSVPSRGRACACLRVGKGGEGRGRMERRRLRHNVFQWFCAQRDQRWQRSPKLRGPYVMTLCLKVWLKTPRPLLGNSTLGSL